MENRPILLFVDATLQQQKESRTYQICQSYLNRWQELHTEYEIRHLRLNEEKLSPLLLEDITKREQLVAGGEFSHEELAYAREFAEADRIVIGAPYWEFSFPSILKVYIERVSVCGLTFRYMETGTVGLCKAQELVYITSSGGFFHQYDLGTEYVRGLCEGLWNIPNFRTVSAQGLDIVSADVQRIVDGACKEAAELAG